MNSILQLNHQITAIPSIHCRATFAQEVRRTFLAKRYDCVAVELPVSLKNSILQAVQLLPTISILLYQEANGELVYVPIEPSDSIIEAVRMAQAERIPLEFIDLNTPTYQPETYPLPDEYAIKIHGLETYYHTIKKYIPPAKPNSQRNLREKYMAYRLNELCQFYQNILFVCGIAHLEGIRKHLTPPNSTPNPNLQAHTQPHSQPQIFHVHPSHIYFLTGELPYFTYLYEKLRSSIDLSEYDKTDSLKELLLEARSQYAQEFPEQWQQLSPSQLQTTLNYTRNLALLHHRLTPDLYHILQAAKGVGGGSFALKVAETAKLYPYQPQTSQLPTLPLSPKGPLLPHQNQPKKAKNRLPGPPFLWKNIKIERKPQPKQKKQWKKHFNPQHCSWPTEDEIIENFIAHVRKRAKTALGEDQIKIEKFTSSLKDGLELKQTLRFLHKNEIYVKEIPPTRGEVGAVVIIFEIDSPTNEKFPWCSTWYAEHENESTLAFYATDFQQDIIGPQIARAYYGGALFLYPPKPIPNVWTNPQFQTWKQKHLQLTAAGIWHSDQKFIAYLAPSPPHPTLRQFAKKQNKHLVYLPLSTFSTHTLKKMQKFHVLGGKYVRSYAHHYIR